MQRRDFVRLSAYTAVAAAFTTTFGCHNRQFDAEAQPFFFSYLIDAKTIKLAGVAYRRANPGEDNKNKLLALILAGSNLPTHSNDDAIRVALQNQVKKDFETGKVIAVDGWILSLTEARQCALFSIL